MRFLSALLALSLFAASQATEIEGLIRRSSSTEWCGCFSGSVSVTSSTNNKKVDCGSLTTTICLCESQFVNWLYSGNDVPKNILKFGGHDNGLSCISELVCSPSTRPPTSSNSLPLARTGRFPHDMHVPRKQSVQVLPGQLVRFRMPERVYKVGVHLLLPQEQEPLRQWQLSVTGLPLRRRIAAPQTRPCVLGQANTEIVQVRLECVRCHRRWAAGLGMCRYAARSREL